MPKKSGCPVGYKKIKGRCIKRISTQEWRETPKDYRSIKDGQRWILMGGKEGTHLEPVFVDKNKAPPRKIWVSDYNPGVTVNQLREFGYKGKNDVIVLKNIQRDYPAAHFVKRRN